MFCNKCGNKLAEGAAFCANCGAPAPAAATSAPPPPPTSAVVAEPVVVAEEVTVIDETPVVAAAAAVPGAVAGQAPFYNQAAYPGMVVGNPNAPGTTAITLAVPDSVSNSGRLFRDVPRKIWQGDTSGAMAEVRDSVTSGSAFGIFGVISLLAGLSAMIGLAIFWRGVRSEGFGFVPGLPGGLYFRTLMFPAIIIFLAYLFRVLTVFFTLRLRGVGSFLDAARIVAVPALLQFWLAAVAFVLALIPGMLGIILPAFLLPTLGILFWIITEILIYVGVAREVRGGKSPVIPYAFMFLAFVILMQLVMLIFSIAGLQQIISTITDGVGSMFNSIPGIGGSSIW